MGRPLAKLGGGKKAAMAAKFGSQQQQKQQKRKGPAFDADADLGLSGSDSEELDAFKSRKDKVSLHAGDGSGDDMDDDDEEAAVYDLSDASSSGDDEDEGDDDDGDEEDDIEHALQQGGTMAQLARQAKALGQKLKSRQKAEFEEDDEEGDDKQQDKLWGANKRAYYDADVVDPEALSDEELLKEEEEEVLRLQKERAAKHTAADYGLDDDEGAEASSSEDEEERAAAGRTMGALAKKGGVSVEQVAVDMEGLDDEARQAALLADAPELMSLLAELQASLTEVRHRVGPLLSELKSGGLATSEGLSYLEAKHLLLTSYCSHIVFYLLLKAEGRPVRDHPVITRLIEIRAYLEKIRPIDKQLQYQIDKLLRATALAHEQEEGADQQRHAAAAGGDDDEGERAGPGPGSAADADMLRFGPRPSALVPKVPVPGTAGDAGAPAGVYRPPKLNPTSMEADAEAVAGGGAALSAQERRRLKDLRARASRSDTLRALAAELEGAPEEERVNVVAGMDSMAALKLRQRFEARAAVEEDMFSRVPLSKDEAKKLRQQRRAGLSGAGLLEDFGDEVADLVDAARGSEGAAGRGNSLNDLFAKQKVSQRFGADHPSVSGQRLRGGDEDLPRRPSLGDRRAAFDSVAARRGGAAGGGSEDYDGGAPDEEYDLSGGRRGGKRRSGEEDEFYAAAKGAADERKKARKDKYTAPGLMPPLEDPSASGARAITDEIQRNRGLTPHRRRDQKNPRKKNRMKFEKAQVRIKGAVQQVRDPQSNAYAGEATGIKSKVAKSRRLG